jgi:ankyrin repeat protein
VSLLQISSPSLTKFGRFLWVNLQLQQLCRTSRGEDDQELRHALNYLPQDLVAMYTRVFNEIAGGEKHTRKVALECFRWIKFAKQPLSLEVLRTIVALSKSPLTAKELMSRQPPGEYILEECRNLIRLADLHHEIIIPVHFSFLEYLKDLPTDELQGDFWNSLMVDRESEGIIACRCIDWLLLSLPDDWEYSDIWASYMDLSYPTKFFDKHTNYAISGSCECRPDLLASVHRLLGADTGKIASLVRLRLMRMPLGQATEGRNFDETLARNYLLWTSDLYLIPGLSRKWIELEIPKHALHLAVWFRPEEVPKLLLQGHPVDELDASQRTPLSYACAKGCLPTVETLLRAGANTEADSLQKSPLGLAIQNHQLELTRMLLKTNPNICVRSDAEGRVPLMIARTLEMVQLLCEFHDFDLNATDRVGRSILGYYVGGGAIRFIRSSDATHILEYLISRGANMHAKSKARMNLVDYAACRFDSFEELQFLLQRDPNLLNKEAHEWIPLHWACRQGNSNMAMTLLELGSESKKITTSQPPQSWTPYEILIHYGESVRGFDESTRRALGQPENLEIDADLLPQEQIEYSSLEATDLGQEIECPLCTMQVSVSNTVSFGFYLLSCDKC